MRIIAIERPDGGVSIMRILEETEGGVQRELDKWADLNPGGYLGHREITEHEIPKDRTFRNAWRHDLSVDMPRARDMWRAKMREARKPKLESLDIEAVRADEDGDKQRKADVVKRKKELRDVTELPAIEAAQTPDELKAIWPDALA
jgi:hypothetical protein